MSRARKVVNERGRSLAMLATRTLRHYNCGLCGQRLDRLRKDAASCGAIYAENREACHWNATLNAMTAPTKAKRRIRGATDGD